MLELRSNHVTVGANMSVAGSLNVGSAQLDVVREIASVASAVDQTNRSLVASVADIASFISDQNASIASLTATLAATQSEVVTLKDQLEETATNASVVVASLSDKLINVQGSPCLSLSLSLSLSPKLPRATLSWSYLTLPWPHLHTIPAYPPFASCTLNTQLPKVN
jgi:hypothetical protein